MDMDIDMDDDIIGTSSADLNLDHGYGYYHHHHNNNSFYSSSPHVDPPPPPPPARAITSVHIVVDTNVLLAHLMVIQKFVEDVERIEWPAVVVIPQVVISELDWQKTTRRSISWSARAASRWILEKLKETRDVKVLKVQASEETLIGAGSGESQPDRNTENDIKIRDCCRFLQKTRHEPVYLLSGDVNLCIRGESDYIQTLEPKRNWSSRVIAEHIFGSGVSARFNDYVQSVRPDRTTALARVTAARATVNSERMEIDVDLSMEWIPSHALDDLHLQVVDHFTILLKELVQRHRPEVIEFGQKGEHAVQQSKSFSAWTAADCVEYLATLRRITSLSTTPKLESFLSKPHCRDANARGRRRGQDWSRRQWEIGIGALGKMGEIWGDQAIHESLAVLRIAVEETFRLQLRPT